MNIVVWQTTRKATKASGWESNIKKNKTFDQYRKGRPGAEVRNQQRKKGRVAIRFVRTQEDGGKAFRLRRASGERSCLWKKRGRCFVGGVNHTGNPLAGVGPERKGERPKGTTPKHNLKSRKRTQRDHLVHYEEGRRLSSCKKALFWSCRGKKIVGQKG